jgi:tetrahydromethanopterin S-methyltransferase subunit H
MCPQTSSLKIRLSLIIQRFNHGLSTAVWRFLSFAYSGVGTANFVIAGPIEYPDAVFPAFTIADALIASKAQNLGVKISPNHPLYKIF